MKRPTTKVIGAPKPKERWELERARMINRQTEFVKEAREKIRESYAIGRNAGLLENMEITNLILQKKEFFELLQKEAMRELGMQIAKEKLTKEVEKFASSFFNKATLTSKFRNPTDWGAPIKGEMVVVNTFEVEKFRYHVGNLVTVNELKQMR